jgi:putative effector of murein hydrolase LrgA (UPF0299 family)
VVDVKSGARTVARLVLLFAPVAVGVVGLALVHTHTAVGVVILISAGIWMGTAFVIRHRDEIR